MNKIFKMILLGMCLISLTGCFSNCRYTEKYEYIDMLGNTGLSNHCYIASNGNGLICEIDRGRIQVSQYKKIFVEKVCPNE